MALSTYARCAHKALIGMASNTIQFSMLPVQRKDRGMIKSTHSIHTIMASQAILAIITDMDPDKFEIMHAVAILTGREHLTGIVTLPMTGIASDWRRIIIHLMLSQAKTSDGVVKELHGSQGWIEIPSLMVRMAGLTCGNVIKVRVDPIFRIDLVDNLYMACQAHFSQRRLQG